MDAVAISRAVHSRRRPVMKPKGNTLARAELQDRAEPLWDGKLIRGSLDVTIVIGSNIIYGPVAISAREKAAKPIAPRVENKQAPDLDVIKFPRCKARVRVCMQVGQLFNARRSFPDTLDGSD